MSGGIHYFTPGGALTLTNSTFTGNEATGGSGGALFWAGPNAALFMDGCTITGNKAKSAGGLAIEAAYGTADISNSTISGNTATNSGGGGIRYSMSAPTSPTIRNCEISNNVAAARRAV